MAKNRRRWARSRTSAVGSPNGVSRGADVVVAVGGGVVTDVAGFAASAYHRGTAVVHVPTTLLGMVDAAIGGKTGVNLAEGKNLVGAFWQPSGVLCDTAALDTLPPREMRCGLGEVAKYHFLTGDDLDQLTLDERVAACRADQSRRRRRGRARRRPPGHPQLRAHARARARNLPAATTFAMAKLSAVGLVYAAEVAELLGRIDRNRVDDHRRVVASYDLPLRPPPHLSADEVLPLFARDKKAIGGVTFVLDGPAGIELVGGIHDDVLRAAYARLSR